MDDARKLALLWDKLAIDQLMLGFGQALDRHDWAAYRACFPTSFTVDFSDLTGQPACTVDADAWVAFARAALEPVKCLHRYTNHLVTVRGDRAQSVLYMEANHFRPSERGGSEHTQHGWYENEYARIDGRWTIARLRQRISWTSGNEGVLDLQTAAVREAYARLFSKEVVRDA